MRRNVLPSLQPAGVHAASRRDDGLILDVGIGPEAEKGHPGPAQSCCSVLSGWLVCVAAFSCLSGVFVTILAIMILPIHVPWTDHREESPSFVRLANSTSIRGGNMPTEVASALGWEGALEFGVTRGPRRNKTGGECGKKMKRWCEGWCSKDGDNPTEDLLKPGRLSLRTDLPHLSQCWLWYTNVLYTRPTGSALGFSLPRLGPGLDSKGWFTEALERHERKLGCKNFQAYPPTFNLNNSTICRSFWFDNGKWAPSPQSLWFMKKDKGALPEAVPWLS